MSKKILSILLTAAMLFTSLLMLSASAAPLMRGDVDADAAISSADARLALRGSVGLETLTADFIMRADVDANGAVESSDARTILRTSVGLDSIAANDCTHQVEKWEPVTQKDGSYTTYHKGVCALCHETLFADHDMELEITKPYTCTTAGEGIEKCICGITGDSAPIPAQHTWEDVEGTRVDATCTTDGSVDLKCSVCGKTMTEFLPKGHTPGDKATCTTPQVCTRCGEVIEQAMGHKFKEGLTITATKGIRCERCGDYAVPSFNDLVNVLKDGTHRYTGIIIDAPTLEPIKMTGIFKSVIDGMISLAKMSGEDFDINEMLKEFNSEKQNSFISNQKLTNNSFYLFNESVVSKLADNDAAITMEVINGVDFLKNLPDSFALGSSSSSKRTVDLTKFKNADIGSVRKITVKFAPERNSELAKANKDSAIANLDNTISDITEANADDLAKELGGNLQDLSEIPLIGPVLAESELNLDCLANTTVYYYFDAITNAPIAAYYDNLVYTEVAVNSYYSDFAPSGRDSKVTGTANLTFSNDVDSYYLFDSYFHS